MQYACEKWTYKRSKYSAHAHTDTTHTHTHTCLGLKNVQPKTEEFSTLNFSLLSSLHSCFVLFCFGSAPAHEGAIWNWNCFRNLKCWQAAHKNIFIIKQRTSNHFRSWYASIFTSIVSGHRANRISRFHFVCKWRAPKVWRETAQRCVCEWLKEECAINHIRVDELSICYTTTRYTTLELGV